MSINVPSVDRTDRNTLQYTNVDMNKWFYIQRGNKSLRALKVWDFKTVSLEIYTTLLDFGINK